MARTIEYSETAVKGLAKLDRAVAKRVRAFLDDRIALLDDPRGIGEALTGSALGEFWKYRVGDYRVIAKIKDDRLQILVVKIGNRRDIDRP